MPNPTSRPAGVEIDHPDWCDTTACTVTPAVDALEGHAGHPVTVTTKHGYPRKLTVTASLYQPAKSYITLEFQGLDDDHMPVAGTTQIPAEEAARLATMLLDLAATAGAAAGQPASGTPQSVIREAEDIIDIVGRGGRVPLTFAEARDIEDQISAILAIFDPRPGDRPASDVMNDIMYREHRARERGQPDATPGGARTGAEVDR
jgi:hypothetical protein